VTVLPIVLVFVVVIMGVVDGGGKTRRERVALGGEQPLHQHAHSVYGVSGSGGRWRGRERSGRRAGWPCIYRSGRN